MSTLREVLLFQGPPAHPRTSWRHCGARTWKHASEASGSTMLLAYAGCCVTFMVGWWSVQHLRPTHNEARSACACSPRRSN